MRIGVFTYGMDARPTGIARYAAELTRALRRTEPSLEIILLNPYPASQNPWYREFESYPLANLGRLPAVVSLGNLQLHRAAQKLGLDILHDPCGVAPFLVPGVGYKRVTTLHDAVPYIYPETQPLLTRLTFATLVRASRVTADAILTVSTSAADDLVHYAGIPRHKLFITPNGVPPPPPCPAATVSSVLEKLAIHPPYFLYVGALHPRKNLARVAQAFAALRAQQADARLVIVGPPSWGAQAVLQNLTEQSRADASVILTGFVTDEELAALYCGARALVFPSLYEGFGLPALEAMAHGTPVIGSNTSSLPEVVGDAGLLVDPHSAEAIAQAMQRLLEDDTLHSALSVRGRQRSARFSWDNTARKTLEVYQLLLREKPSRTKVRAPSGRPAR